jgi:hypothetical protein
MNAIEGRSVSSRINDWLAKEGLPPTTRQPDGFEFAIDVSGFTIARPIDSDKLLINTSVDLTEADEREYAGLSTGSRSQLNRDLTWMLHDKGVPFRIERPGDALGRITLMAVIYDDGLTKDRLMQALNGLRSVAGLAALRISAALASRRETTSP